MFSGTMLTVILVGFFLLNHCAGYGDEDATKKESLSVLLVPFPAPSHMMGMATLGEELIQRGHNVTFCVACIRPEYVEIGKQISNTSGMRFLSAVRSDEHCHSERVKHGAFDLPILNLIKIGNIVDFFWRVSQISKQLVHTLGGSSEVDWDVIIGEYLLWPLAGTLAKKWNVPIVHFSNALDFQPTHLPHWSYPTYGTGYNENLTFLQRLHLTLLLPVHRVIVNLIEVTILKSGNLDDVRENIRPGIMTPYIVSSSFGFEYPRPLLPLFHYVGPMIKTPNIHKHMNGLLKSWLDSKENLSVIYISMGTTIELTGSQIMAITRGVLSTTYNALWSLRGTVFQEIVYRIASHHNKHRFFLANWLPQQSVIQHRSIAMAILHGGMGGASQCLYYGVPEIIIPFALDQRDVAARVVSGGAGLVIHKDRICAARVAEAIRTVNTSSYRKAAVRFRKILQLGGGKERAANLVEFYADVGFEHLVPAYAKHKWSSVKYYNVDVYTFLLIMLLLTVYTLYRFRNCCFQYSCRCRDYINITGGVRRKRTLFLAVLVVFTLFIVIAVHYTDHSYNTRSKYAESCDIL